MREHEVPTHVGAEDRVLLWFTFPQIVAMVAVCALSYGVYRYAPVGPSEVRMGLAVLFGLFGIAMVVVKIAGRRLPLVVADLLRYRLGPRRYVGSVSQLVRSEAPAPVQRDTGTGPVTLLAMRVRRNARRLGRMMESARRRIRRRKRSGSGRNGRMPFRPHRWFGKDRHRPAVDDNGKRGTKRDQDQGKEISLAVDGSPGPSFNYVRCTAPGSSGRRGLAGRNRLRGLRSRTGPAPLRGGAHRHRRKGPPSP